MKKNSTHYILLSACALAATVALASCPGAFSGTILTGERNIIVDIPDAAFTGYAASSLYADRGIGAQRIHVDVTTDTGTASKELVIADLDVRYNYTQVVVPVTGKLSSVAVTITLADTSTLSVQLDEWKDGDSLYGWETFANVPKFRLTIQTNEVSAATSTLALAPGPLGGKSLRLLHDSGVTDVYAADTDKGSSLIAGQIAIEPQWLENPTGLTYSVYALVVDEDLQALNDPALNEAASYYPDPWNAAWSCDEIITSGKSIHGTSYKLESVAADVDPLVEGYASYVRNYAADTGKYLLVGIVATDGTISVPSEVVIFKIR